LESTLLDKESEGDIKMLPTGILTDCIKISFFHKEIIRTTRLLNQGKFIELCEAPS